MSPWWSIGHVLIWGVTLVYMSPGAWGAITGSKRRGDLARLVCWSYSFSAILFSFRRLLFPDSEAVWGAVYAVSYATAILTIASAWGYGRGPIEVPDAGSE